MTVAELIERLQQFPADAEVRIPNEYSCIVGSSSPETFTLGAGQVIGGSSYELVFIEP